MTWREPPALSTILQNTKQTIYTIIARLGLIAPESTSDRIKECVFKACEHVDIFGMMVELRVNSLVWV
jgi:hypothetical protein